MTKQKVNRNYAVSVNPDYLTQQHAINKICAELDLVAYRPDYHALAPDCNTVLIYTAEDHAYNLQLEEKWRKLGLYPLESEYRKYLLTLENTDINGCFNLRFMNCGKIDLRGRIEAPLRAAIEEAAKNRQEVC